MPDRSARPVLYYGPVQPTGRRKYRMEAPEVAEDATSIRIMRDGFEMVRGIASAEGYSWDTGRTATVQLQLRRIPPGRGPVWADPLLPQPPAHWEGYGAPMEPDTGGRFLYAWLQCGMAATLYLWGEDGPGVEVQLAEPMEDEPDQERDGYHYRLDLELRTLTGLPVPI